MRQHITIACAAVAAAVAFAGQAKAADIGVSALKYIAIDKESAAGKSKTVYVAKVPEATKHSNDVTDISVQLSATYAGDLGDAAASFEVPAGESVAKGPGWLVSKDSVAKYVNKDAPGGPTGAKVVVIKPTKLLKLIGKTRGDSSALDMIAAGAPTGSVFTAYSITSGGTTDNFCSEFAGCSFKVIGGGSGRKLVCKGGSPDGGCAAASTCGNGVVEGAEECDDGNPDPTDGCTNECTLCGNSVVTAPETCDPPGGGCALNCQPVGCGNGLVEAPETCDDGNTVDGDSCPSNCIIEACTPNAGSDLTATVSFAGSNDVAGIQVFVDYPEGKVIIPGSADQIPFGIIDGFPNAFANTLSNDLDYALRQAYVDTAATPAGQLFQIHFETCSGAAAPTDGEFSCSVEAAGDVDAAEIQGVTCSVDVP